jgi:hypothetical protein
MNSVINLVHFFQDELCDKPCTGDASQTCGGYLTMNVYETNVSAVEQV